MIPPDLLARAREAFDANSRARPGFEAALSVLSAAWPEADGRLKDADKIAAVLDRMLTQLACSDNYAAGGGSPDVWRIQNSHIRGMVADIRAALAAFPEDKT